MVLYFNSEPFYSKYDKGFLYNDKSINIKWPRGKKKLSQKDNKLPTFEKLKNEIF